MMRDRLLCRLLIQVPLVNSDKLLLKMKDLFYLKELVLLG